METLDYNARMAAGRTALEAGKWDDARAAFKEALKIRDEDEDATKGIADADAQEKKQRDEGFRKIAELSKATEAAAKRKTFDGLMERGAKSLQEENFADADAAFNEAKGMGVADAQAATALADAKQKGESKQRYNAAIAAARSEIGLKHHDPARDAVQRALKERPNDKEAAKLLADVEAIKPIAIVDPPKPPPAAPQPPPGPAYGTPKVFGPFGVYANRVQGVPLDKKGDLVPVRTDLDKEQYEEALSARKSWLTVNKGCKVKIEASGKWYSGPTGAWVTADGKRDDGRESLKNFRAFTGPGNSYNIAMLVVYVSDKELTEPPTKNGRTNEYKRIEDAGQIWAYKGEPLEFVMPATGILRMQQNRDGYFDVTQGALGVTITISEPAVK
jgi:tetratricopeptide (TPR) repeat protein